MQRFLTLNFTKICLTVYDVHEKVHLWPHIKYALLWNNMIENQNHHVFSASPTYEIKDTVWALILSYIQTDRHTHKTYRHK